MRACIRVSIDCEGGITVTTKTMKTTREFGTVLDFKEKMEKASDDTAPDEQELEAFAKRLRVLGSSASASPQDPKPTA